MTGQKEYGRENSAVKIYIHINRWRTEIVCICTYWKHYRTKKSHAVLVYSKMECPRLLTEKSLLMGSSLPCASIPFWCNNFIHKDWVSWLVFLEDKRFDLLMERQTAVIILVYFPPNSRITPQVSDFWWTLRKYVFWILDHIYSLLLFFPIYFL